ncbi:MAG: DNA polymerase III subunit epsilon [Zoogloeaceae bacterium]|jgi:DNA polymerase-3 subunit epsilon|nr:DNA polymerase III subunit epsilon [Zoogloeaceae bacterium]
MRQVVLDTETTGLEPHLGHRIIEIGCVELENRRLTKRRLHHYINPEREIDAGAQKVHGISREDLEDKPRFAQIAGELREFIAGAELVIHNADFDVAFLDMEFGRIGAPGVAEMCAGVLDTLKLARDLYPGKSNSLDALCERCQISNAHRVLHGALLDAELLAEVYLALTRGQESLIGEESASQDLLQLDPQAPREPRPPLLVRRASAEEREAHRRILENIQKESKGKCLWLREEGAEVPAGYVQGARS